MQILILNNQHFCKGKMHIYFFLNIYHKQGSGCGKNKGPLFNTRKHKYVTSVTDDTHWSSYLINLTKSPHPNISYRYVLK